MADDKKELDRLREKFADLNTQLTEVQSQAVPDVEVKSKIPQRLFAGIGDALQSYASIRQGGPAVQGNIERFLEQRMKERQEKRSDLQRQREAEIGGIQRQMAAAEGELNFARGSEQARQQSEQDFANRQALAEQEHGFVAEQNNLDRTQKEALSVADLEWRKQRMREGFEREDNAKIDAQNQAAAQALDMLIEGDGTMAIDPETQQQVPVNLSYQIAQGMPYEMFQNRVERVLLGTGVSPMAEDAIRKNAEQAWRLAGGSVPGDPQAPVTPSGTEAPGTSLLGRPMIWGLSQGLNHLQAIGATGANRGKQGENPNERQTAGGFGAAQPLGGKR